MSARVTARRAAFGQGLKRDLIQQTAYFMLVGRTLEGLGAWLLFNEAFLPSFDIAWPVHVLFITYFAANTLLGLGYRSGKVTTAGVLLDVCVNLGTMTVAAGVTGGMMSPVVLLCLIKVAGYLLVFSTHAGVLAIVMILVGFGTLDVGAAFDWWTIGVIAPEVDSRIDVLFRGGVLGTLLVAAPWLLRHVADKEKQISQEAQRARSAAEREHAAYAVARALLAVSEAVSQLTRLDEILNKVVDIAPRVLALDYCGLFLWSDERAIYEGAAVSGVDPGMAHQLTTIRLAPADVPDFEWVRRLGHCAVVAPRGIARLGVPEAPTLLVAPLVSGARFHGVLQFGRRGGQTTFTQNDIRIADGVASQTAVALERARLVEQSHRLVRAVESTGEAVLIIDRDRRIVFTNQAFEQMFGYTRDALRGRDCVSLGTGMPDGWITEVQQAVADGKWRGEAMARRSDGTLFPLALHASIIRGDDGRVQGSVAIMEDISAEKQLQEQLQRTERLAAAGEMAAGVAHEVNNALVGILGQTELARNATDIDTLRTAVVHVETQGRRIAEIVRELLGFARPRVPERGPVDLRALVRDTLTLMAHDLGRNHVRSVSRVASDLPQVLADATQIQQVLVNLFTNAMQAMQPDGGTLTVRVQPATAAVCVEVEDTGRGIAPEDVPRVFDPFFSTKQEGTGLGLSVSYAIARAHDGDLTVRSTVGQGATFVLTLPASIGMPASEPRPVLLVDDDAAVADTLREMLTREGLVVRHVATGADALAVLEHEAFDAVFLDVRLPDISGPEVYARLTARQPEQAKRVIFVTGGLWRIDSRGLREQLPPQPTLSKPCTSAQIHEVLRLLRDRRAAA